MRYVNSFFHSQGLERSVLLNYVHFYIFKDSKRHHPGQKEYCAEIIQCSVDFTCFHITDIFHLKRDQGNCEQSERRCFSYEAMTKM